MYSRVHAVGDSHTLHMGGLFHVFHIQDAQGQGATAHNLIEERSSTDSKRKLAAYLDTLDPERDIILMSFGEVDCRLHIRDDAGVKATVERYTQAIENVRARGFRVIVHGVIGAVPQDNTWRQADYPDAATRGHIVLAFNAALSTWCEENGVGFLDLGVADGDGVLPDDFTDDTVHLNHRAFPLYQDWAAKADVGPDEQNVVWCVQGMSYFGRLISDVLGWPLYIDTPVLDADTVYIIGLYDPPNYQHTLSMTAGAKRRIIHWCGSDVYSLVRPDFLPEATHLCESDGLRQALFHKGIDATVCPFPTTITPGVTPLPDGDVVNVYLGGSPAKYGEGTVRALAEAMPDVQFHVYPFGKYTPEQMHLVIARAKVYLRLVYPDGSANSAREHMAAGRRAICATDVEYAKRVAPDDLPALISALRVALRHTEPDYDAAAYYHEFNSRRRYLNDVRGHL